MRIGVLASSGGTNLQAILRAGLPVVAVVVDRPCGATAVAEAAGVPAELVLRESYGPDFDRGAYTERIVEALERHGVELVVMAGFGTVLDKQIHDAYPSRILNTHPALLPAFPGWHAVEEALAYGVKVTGCTVHLATLEVDSGPILAQEAVPVFDDATPETLPYSAQLYQDLKASAAEVLAQATAKAQSRGVRATGDLVEDRLQARLSYVQAVASLPDQHGPHLFRAVVVLSGSDISAAAVEVEVRALGLFFLAVGASVDFGLVAANAGPVAALVAALVVTAATVLVSVASVLGLRTGPAATALAAHLGGSAPLAALLVAVAAAPAQSASRLVVRGAGFGHGIGMSQYGAFGFAERGTDHGTILRHYYSGTQIGKLDGGGQVRVLLKTAGRIVFGSATYVGNVSAAFQTFAEQTGRRCIDGTWRDKVAAGFTNNLNDALAWGIVPLYLAASGASAGELAVRALSSARRQARRGQSCPTTLIDVTTLVHELRRTGASATVTVTRFGYWLGVIRVPVGRCSPINSSALHLWCTAQKMSITFVQCTINCPPGFR